MPPASQQRTQGLFGSTRAGIEGRQESSKKFFIDSKLPHSWLFFARIPADPQLVANLVILHNVEQMTRVLAELREEGSNISPDVLAGLSPYRTSHINRFGDYTLDLKRQVEPIDFSRRILAAPTR